MTTIRKPTEFVPGYSALRFTRPQGFFLVVAELSARRAHLGNICQTDFTQIDRFTISPPRCLTYVQAAPADGGSFLIPGLRIATMHPMRRIIGHLADSTGSTLNRSPLSVPGFDLGSPED